MLWLDQKQVFAMVYHRMESSSLYIHIYEVYTRELSIEICVKMYLSFGTTPGAWDSGDLITCFLPKRWPVSLACDSHNNCGTPQHILI